MSSHLHRLIDDKANQIILDEGFARDLAEAAYVMQQDGHSVVAEGMLNLSRHHRIRGMKVRAEIAVLSGTIVSSIDEEL